MSSPRANGNIRLSLPAVAAVAWCASSAVLLRPAAGLSAPPAPAKKKASSWQRRLDKALLDVDLAPQARFRNLQRALKDPDLPSDVAGAFGAIRRDGFGKGHPAFIDALWPEGTTARSDLEGLAALRSQVPEALRELGDAAPDILKDASERRSGTSSPPPKIDSLPTPDEIAEELKNALRSTPRGLEAPKYAVVRTLEGPPKLGAPERIEVRKYQPFSVATTPSMGGNGFNALASYLFGGNEEEEAMAMTMPVLVTRTTASDADDRAGTMKFVIPSSRAEAPPTPLAGDDVEIERVPERLVAVKPFPGLATREEIDRQREALLDVLRGNGLKVANEGEATVLQYNSPLTIPWRRRNEVAFVVAEEEEDGDGDGDSGAGGRGSAALEAWQARASATSWYDAGVRL